LELRRQLARCLLPRCSPVGSLVSVGIETPAVEMPVGKRALGSRRRLSRWLLARRRAVGGLVSGRIETPAVEMALGETPHSRVTNIAPLSIEIETLAGEMAVSKTPRSIVTDLALVGVVAEKKLELPSKESSLLSRHLLFILRTLTPVHPPCSSLHPGPHTPLVRSPRPPFCAPRPGSCCRHPRPQFGPHLARCSRWIWLQA